MKLFSFLVAALSASAVAGCYMSSGLVASSSTVDAGAPSSGDPTGVPCDVQSVLVHSCQSCHGATPSGGAPTSLVSLQDLTQPSRTDPTKSELQLGVERMQNNTMPPGGGASASDLTTLETWVTAGMPPSSATCSTTDDPLNSAPTCTSGSTVAMCNSDFCGGSQMNPGVPCGNCHGSVIGGTVYATGHEPNLCNGGHSGSITVTGTDAKNKTFSITADPNSGNFILRKSGYTAPFTNVKVTSAKGTRSMSQAAPNGDCNHCHTPTGANNAPGRITVPF